MKNNHTGIGTQFNSVADAEQATLKALDNAHGTVERRPNGDNPTDTGLKALEKLQGPA